MFATAMAQGLPKIKISITPNFEGNKATRLDVRLGIQEPDIAANGTLVSLSLSDPLATTQEYDSKDIEASDAIGKLALSQKDDDDDRHYIAARATKGDVALSFTAKPKLSPGKGEFLHMGAENDGKAIFGPGLGFLPMPKEGNYTFNLDWDLSKAPNGTRAVWSLGEGPSVTAVGPPSFVSESYFAVGQMQSFPPAGTLSNYTTYWFDDPPKDFNITETAVFTQKAFDHMRKFFRDTDDTYRVFARKFPANQSTGAGAKTRSFMFPVQEGNMDPKELQAILSHELVHNWVTASDTDDNYTSVEWYVEGAADFYSARLLFRYGMHTADQFLEQMNGFARAYYANPLIDTSLDQKGDEEDGDAINLPYQRGNMFLVRMDALIRNKSNGTRSIDNVVQALLDRNRAHQGDRLEDILDLLVRDVGPEARTEFEDMYRGKTLVMPENSLGAGFTVEQVQIPRGDCSPGTNGSCDQPTMVIAYQWKRKPGMSDAASVV